MISGEPRVKGGILNPSHKIDRKYKGGKKGLLWQEGGKDANYQKKEIEGLPTTFSEGERVTDMNKLKTKWQWDQYKNMKELQAHPSWAQRKKGGILLKGGKKK